jgi:hypothetical protein
MGPSFAQGLMLQLSSVAARSAVAPQPVGVGDVTAYLQGLGQAAELLKHSVKPATQKAREKAILEFQSWMQRVVKVPTHLPCLPVYSGDLDLPKVR